MRYSSLVLFLAAHLAISAQAQSSATTASVSLPSDVNVANVPDCAKVCLSNSTQYATDCAQIDVKCLCNSPSYVSALSCCLATNCNAADQQTAIQFNIQECAAVNSTAPNFVGCSPFSLTTGGSNKQTTATAVDSTAASTITGALATIPTAFTNTKIGTANFAGSSLLTGSCTVPLFAQITDPAGTVVEFPQVGCALNRGSCCPFDPNEYVGVVKCPADYATTSGACCPNGYSVYYTALGAETPCFSKASKTYLPATTASGSHVSLITDAVFSRRYILVTPPEKQIPAGGIAGITVNAVLFVALPFVIYWLIKRHKGKKAANDNEKAVQEGTGATFPPVEPALASGIAASSVRSPTTAQELASPETSTHTHTPTTFKGMPLPSLTSNPPGVPATYGIAGAVPHEMLGSTYMHEHHPAYTGSSTELSRDTRTPPKTPPQSPFATASTRSPGLSPSSPFRVDSPSNAVVATPLGSPRPLNASPNTRFREGTM